VQSFSAHQQQEEHINQVRPLQLLNPGMSDYTIFVKDQAQVFLGGPPLVKMATGEVVDSETLGGAEMHSSQSGLSDNLASDEFTAILAARRWIRSIHAHLPSRYPSVLPPKYDVDDLLGLVGTDIRKGTIPMGEIIARIVDASRFEVFKPLYGRNMLCAWAYIHGT
jgi:acetyl-CoA carboxylase carboxyltransferase component